MYTLMINIDNLVDASKQASSEIKVDKPRCML
jgi:hypothetical protein